MKVFTEAELSARRIPKEFAHQKALEAIRPVLEEGFRRQPFCLSAAVLIGSSPLNELNPPSLTSDMDVLLFMEDGEGSRFAERVKWWSGVLSPLRATVREKLHVPLEFHAVLKSQMAPTQMRYDKQYLRHAVWALGWGGLLCGRGEEVEHFHYLCPELELPTALAYIDRKVAKTRSASSYLGSLTDEEMARLQANLVNSPFHALRRAFTLANVKYVDSRSGLINSLRDIGDELTEENLKFMRRLGDEYREYVRCKRDALPAGRNPFDMYGMDRVSQEFFDAMQRIREFAVATVAEEEPTM